MLTAQYIEHRVYITYIHTYIYVYIYIYAFENIYIYIYHITHIQYTNKSYTNNKHMIYNILASRQIGMDTKHYDYCINS